MKRISGHQAMKSPPFNAIISAPLLLVLLLLNLSTSPLAGAEISYTAEGGRNLLIPQFDPEIGSLTSISWEYLNVVSVSYEGRNESSQYLGFTVSTTVGFYLGLTERPSSSQLQRVPMVSDFVTVNPGQVVNFSVGATTFRSGEIGPFNPQSFPQFIGSGNVTFYRFLDTTLPEFSHPSAKAAMNDNINVRDNPILTVSYSYVPIPEPSIGILASVFFVSFLFVRFYHRNSRVRQRRGSLDFKKYFLAAFAW